MQILNVESFGDIQILEVYPECLTDRHSKYEWKDFCLQTMEVLYRMSSEAWMSTALLTNKTIWLFWQT